MYSFISKNKFEKFLHLVGFIIRVYYDAQSSERQKPTSIALTEWERLLWMKTPWIVKTKTKDIVG